MANPTGYRDILIDGMWVTLQFSTGALVIALGVGLVLAAARQSNNRILSGAALLYTTVIRGIPDLALLLLVFYSLQLWLNQLTDAVGLRQIDIDPFTAGVVALGTIYGAYFTETFRGAFQAVAPGQIEAARAYGLGVWATFTRVLFPQMMRFALPGLANNWLVMVKSTAIVSIVGLSDITKRAQDAGRGSGDMLYYLCIAAAFYLVMTSFSGLVVRALKRRYSAGAQEALL